MLEKVTYFVAVVGEVHAMVAEDERRGKSEGDG